MDEILTPIKLECQQAYLVRKTELTPSLDENQLAESTGEKAKRCWDCFVKLQLHILSMFLHKENVRLETILRRYKGGTYSMILRGTLF